jgi:GNAT superfamily N-acetyltransferase
MHRSCNPHAQVPPPWTIQPVPHQSVDEVVRFINNARNGMFTGRSLLPDTAALLGDGSCFLEARDGKDLIAVIGYVRYDNRHPQLNYHNIRTVEIVRLYVLPQYRRCGLAAALFSALYDRAVEEDIECLYLHTHPFLEGAIRFWEKCGFEIFQVEDDPEWQTTHMEMRLKKNEAA